MLEGGPLQGERASDSCVVGSEAAERGRRHAPLSRSARALIAAESYYYCGRLPTLALARATGGIAARSQQRRRRAQ
jgi:hypothetical protein